MPTRAYLGRLSFALFLSGCSGAATVYIDASYEPDAGGDAAGHDGGKRPDGAKVDGSGKHDGAIGDGSPHDVTLVDSPVAMPDSSGPEASSDVVPPPLDAPVDAPETSDAPHHDGAAEAGMHDGGHDGSEPPADAGHETSSPLANGSACTSASECASDQCVPEQGATTRVCCATACADEGAASCGDDGSCSANGAACTLYPSGQVCKAAACSGGAETLTSTCNGTGACLPGASSACSPYACGATACDTSCTTSAECASGDVCARGACVPGNCATDADCPAGQICGVDTPNTCGPCIADVQCKADPTYGPSDVCDTTSGACVSGACALANDATCTQNAADVCCSDACVTGDCCDTAACAAMGTGLVCIAHTCTTCDAVTGTTYHVDPVNGDDATATGSGTAGGATSAACAFKTITRALAVIGAMPAAGTVIEVASDGPVSAGETFPIAVPENVTVEGDGTATVDVPANKTGFTLAAPASGLSSLVIDGATLAGTSGVSVTTGSASSTNIHDVTVQNMAGDGIDVSGAGALTLGPGTACDSNGTAASPASGLRITGTATVTITVDSGAAAEFSKNGGHGIDVEEAGSVSIGADAASLDPAVIADENQTGNLYIQQTAAATGATPLNVVSNFRGTSSVTTHGVHIFGGSSLRLRSSYVGGNKLDGILVTTLNPGMPGENDDVSGIDLGDANSAGDNSLQPLALGPLGAPNGGVGLCLDLAATAAQDLSAAGNVFGLTNCANAMTTLTRSNTCTGGDDVGVTGALTTNTITLTKCD